MCQKKCIGSWGEEESTWGQMVGSEGQEGLGVLMLPVFSDGWWGVQILTGGGGNVGTGCKVRSDYDHREGLVVAWCSTKCFQGELGVCSPCLLGAMTHQTSKWRHRAKRKGWTSKPLENSVRPRACALYQIHLGTKWHKISDREGNPEVLSPQMKKMGVIQWWREHQGAFSLGVDVTRLLPAECGEVSPQRALCFHLGLLGIKVANPV